MRILNFTQHPATPEQLDAGVVEPSQEHKQTLAQWLTIEEIPSYASLAFRASCLASEISQLLEEYGCDAAMIGGAPYLMPHLEAELRSRKVRFCYAFSRRIVDEQIQPDGSVRKVHVFRHEGFYFPPMEVE